MFNQFIQEKTDCPDRWYKSSALISVNSSVEEFNSVMKGYCGIWYDFVSFRIDLFETQLKSLLYKKLNCSIKDINYFCSFFKCYRNHFAVLPTQIPTKYIPKNPQLDLYQEIVKYFSNSNSSVGISKLNNINPILVYYYIWNCIYFIMHKNNGTLTSPEFGFDFKRVFDSNKICQLLQEYVINELRKTNVFENDKCEKYLFDNDLTQFNKLLKHSIKDLLNTSGDINDYKKLFSKNYRGRYNNCCDSGLSNIIGNRLCYVIFHDLSMYSLNLSNEMMFPKLIEFYKFIFNFSIYLHCYPFKKDHNEDMSMHQEYYLVQYFNHKDSIFENIAQLKQFNYLNFFLEFFLSISQDGDDEFFLTCKGSEQWVRYWLLTIY